MKDLLCFFQFTNKVNIIMITNIMMSQSLAFEDADELHNAELQ